MQRGQIFVGPSGWSYPSWTRTVAKGVRLQDRLPFVASLFNAAEVNGSYYVQIAPETYRKWADVTPPAFRFAVKGHRFVTHYKRLRGCRDSVRRLRRQAAGLGDKLAAVLWQLPARMTADVPRLDEFLDVLGTAWNDTRHVLELRHRSWFVDAVAERLHASGVAACWSDAPDFPMWDVVTADFVYIRLHGHTRKYASSYSPANLRGWARRIARCADAGRDVHVYFDNDVEGAAIRNARALAALLDLSQHGERDGTAAT